MKIKVEATDLRDDKVYSATVEGWETLDTVRQILADKVPGATPKEQFFYIRDEFINASIPADQLRKKARAAGLLDGVEEPPGEPKLARCFLYVSPTPLDFSDMLNDDLIKKLRGSSQGEVKQIIFRLKVKDAESRLCIPVDSSTITVEQFKQILLKKMGPSSLTGITAEKLLLYERDKQPGRPLEGSEMQPLFGSKIKIDIDGYLVHDEINLRLVVKKYLGLVRVEEHLLPVFDHQLLEDLLFQISQKLENSQNKQVQALAQQQLHAKLNGHSLSPKGRKSLQRKFGVPPESLWLRAFDVKDKSPVIVYI